MAEQIYNVGDQFTMQTYGKPAGTLEVKSITTDDGGKRHVHAEVIELVQGYSGEFKVGTILSFPEKEFISTYTQPGR